MPAPSATWATKNVHITYRNFITGDMQPGRWTASIGNRVSNTLADGRKQVFRAGVVASGDLNTVEGTPSLQIDLPVIDDPDNTPQGGTITLTVTFTGPNTGSEVFNLAPSAAWPAVTDLAGAYDPSFTGTAASTVVRGVPGGVAGLDNDGSVIDAAGNKVSGGGGGSTSWAGITDKPATFPPTIGTTATTAKAGNYQPSWSQVTDKPAEFPPASHTQPASTVTGLAAVATSGAYADLAGKPSIPAEPVAGTTAGTFAAGNDVRLSNQRTPVDGSVTDAKVAPDAAIAVTKLGSGTPAAGKYLDGAGSWVVLPGSNGGSVVAWTDVTGKPTFAVVATSGAYSDLSGRPTAGTTADSYAAGNDARLSDQRTPTNASVTDAKVSSNAAIAASKLGLGTPAAGKYLDGAGSWTVLPAGGGGSNTVVPASPLQRLSSQKTQRNPISRNNIAAYGSATLFSDTTGNPGAVTSIWMTISPIAQANNAHLQIFVDGEVVPSFDVDLGTLFLGHLGAGPAGFLWSTTHMHGEGGAAVGGYMNFPIPYTTSIRVVLNNPTDTNLFIFTMVDWQPNLVLPYRIKTITRPWLQRHTLTALQVDNMFYTPAGSPGWLAWLGYVAAGATGISYLERNIELWLDDEVNPSVKSSGGEDFFFGSYYYLGKQTISTPDMTLSYQGSNQVLTAVDLLAHGGGYKFNSRMRMDLTSKPESQSGHDYGFTAIFYTPSDSAWAAPRLTALPPSPPSVAFVTMTATSAAITVGPPPSDNGATVTTVTVTATPDSGAPITTTVAASNRTVNVTGLASGSNYTFTVTATNSAGTSIPSRAVTRTTTVVVAPITPDSVSGLLGWWKADALALTDGAAVTSWPASGGSNPLAFTPPTTAAQPTFRAGILNSQPVIRFDGVDDALSTVTSLSDTTGPYTVFGVWRINQSGKSDVRLINNDASNGLFLVSTRGDARLVMFAGGGDAVAGTIGTVFTYVTAVSGSTGFVSVNGVPGGTTNVGSNAPRVLVMGRWPNAQFWQLDIAEVIIYTGQISATNRQGIETYLASKYNIA